MKKTHIIIRVNFSENCKMQIEKTLRHFHTSLDFKQLSSLKGEIYECYCYEKIVNKYSNICFIKLKENKNANKDGFYISSAGTLCYRAYSIDLGEFDIIGFDSKGNVHWYEITKQKTNLTFVADKLLRKKELMKKLFGCYNFYLVLPEENIKLSKLANVLYIPEPDYTNLIKPSYSLNFRNDNFINLEFLNNKIKKYDYIKDLVYYSNQFFKNKQTNYNSFLYERLYDIENILNDSFSYYNLEKNVMVLFKSKKVKFSRIMKELRELKLLIKRLF